MKIHHWLTSGLLCASIAITGSMLWPSHLRAQPPAGSAPLPTGWQLVTGQAAEGTPLQPRSGQNLDITTTATRPLPLEATFKFRAPAGGNLGVQVHDTDKDTPALLTVDFRQGNNNSASLTALSGGKRMSTSIASTRTWTVVDKPDGNLHYRWRFPQVRNLWDDRDRLEIGAAYATLQPFTEKVFTLRLWLDNNTRQIWLDDRLVAESRESTTGPVDFALQLRAGVQLLNWTFSTPAATGAFLPLQLGAWSHARPKGLAPQPQMARVGRNIPVWLSGVDVNLDDSRYRYRLTNGSGPDAGYVNGERAWPGAFAVDPAELTFRVPYRAWQNAWLLVWADDKPRAVRRGALRFFKEQAGYPATTEFEISDRALRSGLVQRLNQKTAAGKTLYLVRVPLDTNSLYGMHDQADQFLDLQLTRPLTQTRSYPDPIYYGFHPAGWPSGLHVAGITLEEAPFDYTLTPLQTCGVFERPETPQYEVNLTSNSSRPQQAQVVLETASYDGSEKAGTRGSLSLPAGGSAKLRLAFDLKRLGWHRARVKVTAGGETRGHELALVMLPPNTRTYGNTPLETRFGVWELLGHYTPLRPNPADPLNDRYLALYRRLGLRYYPPHLAFVNTDLMKKHGFLPRGEHTVGNAFATAVNDDGTINEAAMAKGAASEVEETRKMAEAGFPGLTYFYGGEWAISKEIQYAPWPRYTDEGDRPLTAQEIENTDRHIKIFTAIGRLFRQQVPGARLVLQWGAPSGTLAYLKNNMPRDLVDMYGMDAPQFELLPEVSNMTGSINDLWAFRQEVAKMGWPQLPMAWCEGPFFPTNPGALTEEKQAEYQVRYILLGLTYGVEQFEAGVVPFDAGNYYGAEHYGAGIFHRRPLEYPKPAVAAFATASSMLCGAAKVGPLDTGSLTNYCLAFRRERDGANIYALWRVYGTAPTRIRVRGGKPILTDAMGNPAPVPVLDGVITVPVTSSPVWLTGTEIEKIETGTPVYTEKPAVVTRPLVAMTADKWSWDNSEDRHYATNHFAVRRIPDPNLKAEFGQGEPGRTDALSVTLPVEPGDRPMATRYGQLRLKQPVTIPGKASALGMWVKGNSSWGRVIYQLKDARGETWISVGTRDDWNCDDTHGWSYVSFDGWRYLRFPLPGNLPWDSGRELETTWWGSRDGDGIVDLPLAVEKIIVEARNEVPVAGEMKLVPVRSYKLSGLVAEYARPEDATEKAIVDSRVREPLPQWSGPEANTIAELRDKGTGVAPAIRDFAEPSHFNDGRQMIIHFAAEEGVTYKLYLSRYEDGRGAELIRSGVKNGDTVGGLRPEIPLYFFLTAVRDKVESKPSTVFRLVTKDNFREK